MRVSLIACSRDGSCPTLSKSFVQNVGPFSLEAHGQSSVELICEKEAVSLAKGFNRGAAKARGDVLVFTHDDVEILSSRYMFWEACRLASKNGVGIIGVAGTRVMNDFWWSDGKMLSGACMHGDLSKNIWMSSFGTYGKVVTLDGVFLMMRRVVFDKLKGFDDQFDFDFYDMDITLRAHLLGYENHTYPFHLLHHSVGNGAFEDRWTAMQVKFRNKFDLRLPVSL